MSVCVYVCVFYIGCLEFFGFLGGCGYVFIVAGWGFGCLSRFGFCGFSMRELTGFFLFFK